MSRQRRYQLNHLAQGMCQLCSMPLAKESNCYCELHLLRNREQNRKRNGYRKLSDSPLWHPGGRGRPPLVATIGSQTPKPVLTVSASAI